LRKRRFPGEQDLERLVDFGGSAELAGELRDLAEETGRSQQDLIREAIADYIRNYKLRAFPPEIRHMLTPGKKASPEAMAAPKLQLPPGVTSESLIAEGRRWRDL